MIIFLSVLAALLLIIIVLLLIPIRVFVSYRNSELKLYVKYLFIKIFDIADKNDSTEASDFETDSAVQSKTDENSDSEQVTISEIGSISPDENNTDEDTDDDEYLMTGKRKDERENSQLKKTMKFVKKDKADGVEEEKPSLSEKWESIKVYIPTAKKAFKKLLKLIKIRNLDISLVIGGSDPYSAAMNFSKVNQAFYPILGLICCAFSVTIKETNIVCDYDNSGFSGGGSVEIAATPMSILSLAVFVLINYFKIKSAEKRERKKDL